jgi:hypothetical protein
MIAVYSDKNKEFLIPLVWENPEPLLGKQVVYTVTTLL